MTRICDKSAVSPPLDLPLWETLKREISERTSRWKDGHGANFVPEEWVASALALAGITDDSINYLNRSIRTRGRLTLQHALFFLNLEDKAQAEARATASISAKIRATTAVRSPVRKARATSRSELTATV